MRVLMLLRADADSEAGVPPTAENMAGMSRLIGEMMDAGVLVATEGLKPSSTRKRIKSVGGKVTITDGPFTESKELIAGFALLEVKSWDEALHWAGRFGEVQGDFESEIGPVFEQGDFGAA